MKIPVNKADIEDLDSQNFVKIRSKKHRLTGKPSVTQLISRAESSAAHIGRFSLFQT